MLATVNISKAQTIGGWMSEKELLWLATQAQKYRRIVEFGSYFGRSTRALADNLMEDGEIWAIDPWGGNYYLESGEVLKTVDTYVMPYFLQNLQDHIIMNRVIPVRGFSYSFKCPYYDSLMDMVFIDGDHRYNTVKRDINKGLELLRTGGMLCGHDYDHVLWTGVKKAVDELLGPVQVEDSIWWIRS